MRSPSAPWWPALVALGLSAAIVHAEERPMSIRISSPDEHLVAVVTLTDEGMPRYAIERDGDVVVSASKLGLVRDDADFTRGLSAVSASEAEVVRDRYEILTAKRRMNAYQATRRTLRLETAEGRPLEIVFQVSNDGVAFCYVFPDSDSTPHRLTEEVTSFHFPPETRAWLQPMSVAKTGWERCHPSYEEYYEQDIPVGTPSPLGAGWVYPALFRTGETWVLISECGRSRDYCGTRLRHASPDGEYQVGFPDAREHFMGGPVNPESTLPWASPWRLVVIGDLATVTESMLGVDLADPPAVTVSGPIRPGQASWSWVLLKDDLTTYETSKRFIDYAADMKWEYCLIDGFWDRNIGYERTAELVDYARGKDVGVLLWYNSAGDWNSTPQTPRDRMLTHESRIQEFDRLKQMGVAGLKIDFFGGDGQSVMAYYHDILRDAAPYGFHMNFHGSTLPRGWQRTYPHLMTMEAIKGFEFATFEQVNEDQQPSHAAMLPFTRNVFDPMDYTPMALDQILGSVNRVTTSGFELALSVLFTSGIQHFAEIPEGMAKVPDYVRDFLRALPGVWEDVRFVDGHPGEFVVLARLGNGHWYVAGINGGTREKALTLDLSRLPVSQGARGTLIADGTDGNLSFVRKPVSLDAHRLPVTVPPAAGFVLVLE